MAERRPGVLTAVDRERFLRFTPCPTVRTSQECGSSTALCPEKSRVFRALQIFRSTWRFL